MADTDPDPAAARTNTAKRVQNCVLEDVPPTGIDCRLRGFGKIWFGIGSTISQRISAVLVLCILCVLYFFRERLSDR